MSSDVKRRSKGEITRNKILQAAIEVIAVNGIKGTTHRAVAKQADIQLSLTTYYFVDIKELVCEALIISSNRFLSFQQEILNETLILIKSYSAAELRKISIREKLCQAISKITAEYIYQNILQRPNELAVEQVFFTERMYSPEIANVAQNHISIIEDTFQQLAQFFNKEDPEIDAELAMIAITRIEYRYLAKPIEELNLEHLEALVRRTYGTMMGLRRQ